MRSIFNGDRPLIVGVLTYIGAEQGMLYLRDLSTGDHRRHSVGGRRHSA
jgi:hypothetical protein